MKKSLVNFLAFATLAVGSASAVQAQVVPDEIYEYSSWEWLPNFGIRACDPSACFIYTYVGGDTWVITSVEPRPFPGGRQQN
ncbi:MAG: hypothetical protein LH485_08830 [Sphingomonas bacterium]|nr:hypothetical protein [Sphingomonas bacterium]